MSVLAAIVAALKAIPALRSMMDSLVKEWHEYDARKNAAEIEKREAAKLAALDAAFERVRTNAPPVRQHSPPRRD